MTLKKKEKGNNILNKLRKDIVFFSSLFIILFFALNTVAQVIQAPDNFHGPRTKWVIYTNLPSGSNCTGNCINRHSIIPQIDIELDLWLKKLEETGANAATINLEARRNLISTPMFPTFDISAADINFGRFTPDQRDEQLLDFLHRVQASINRGAVHGNIRFHIHQRLYPRKESARENEFITDFSNFINKAVEQGVDHLIAGIRLGEHGTDGRNYVLDFALKTATAINANTKGWLKEKGGYEMSGDDYGRMFKNIHNQTLSSNFFEEISKVTGYFAFCYKAFGVGGSLKELGYDTNTQNGWEQGMLNGLGLNDLISFIKANREKYPLHANVIFIGDSGDALKQFGNMEYNTTTNILTNAGDGFKGIIGVNGYRRPDKGTQDDHLYFYDALEGKDPIVKPKTIKRWQAWPLNDNNTANMHTITAMSGVGGLIYPSGPILAEPGTNISFEIKARNGYEIDAVFVNETPQTVSSGKIVLSQISADTKVQAIFKKSTTIVSRIATNEITPPYFNRNTKCLTIFNNELINDVEIYNLLGAKVLKTTSPTSKIQLQNLIPGLYLVKLRSLGEQSQVFRINISN